MNKNTVISRTEVVFETPPGLDDLKNMHLKELRIEASSVGVSEKKSRISRMTTNKRYSL